jgi:NADPH:quinone reductase-like Zn-dependent oxidoreductase
MVNLEALRALLASNDVKVLTGQVYSLDEAGKAVGHMLGHHAKGRGVIAV